MPRTLTDPTGQIRRAGTYYDPNEIQVKLTFKEAYKGNLHLYAVDWDKVTRREIVSVNGQSAVLGEFNEGAWMSFPINVAENGTVTITVDRTFGPNAVLSGIFLGEGTTAPPVRPVESAPQGAWVGKYGTAGYDLGAFNEGSGDLTSKASVNLVQGSRYLWESPSSDPRALQNPEATGRTAATYFDPAQIDLQVTFSEAYTGNLELYAVDWDARGRQEMISVNGQTAVLSNFSSGAWVTIPVKVQKGETVTIMADTLAGPNAVLSGIFLG